MEKLEHESKKRRLNPSHNVSLPVGKNDKVGALEKSLVSGGFVIPAIQHAKNLAVAQAQQDGCTGNFKVIDSPYGNFLVPAVPSRAELGG